MNTTFPDETRVWIYQADQPFEAEKVGEIRTALQRFAQQWVSHNQQLRATADVWHQRFVVLMVDETQAGASGCSIDKSVAFMKQLGATYERQLFDRMRFSYRDAAGQVQTVDRDAFAQLYAQGEINEDTLVFDTLVDHKGALDRAFEKRLADSWHKRMV